MMSPSLLGHPKRAHHACDNGIIARVAYSRIAVDKCDSSTAKAIKVIVVTMLCLNGQAIGYRGLTYLDKLPSSASMRSIGRDGDLVERFDDFCSVGWPTSLFRGSVARTNRAQKLGSTDRLGFLWL